MKNGKIYAYEVESKRDPELISLMVYRLCQPGPMYHCDLWLSGNILSSLNVSEQLSSQSISRLLASLGEESVQRSFFERYLKEEEY